MQTQVTLSKIFNYPNPLEELCHYSFSVDSFEVNLSNFVGFPFQSENNQEKSEENCGKECILPHYCGDIFCTEKVNLHYFRRLTVINCLAKRTMLGN